MSDPMGEDPAAAPHDRPRCVGTSKQTGERCGLAPAPGATVCRFHGAGAPQVKAAAERRLQEQAAHAYVARYGVPQHIEWHEAVQQGLDETYGNVLALRDLVQRMAPDALTWGRSQIVEVSATQFPGIDVTEAAGIAPVVALYGQERDRLHRMATDAGKLGLEVRRQQLAESQGAQLADAGRAYIAGVIDALGLDARSAGPVMQRLFADMLRALAGGPVAAVTA